MDSETHKTEPLYEFLAWFETNKKRVLVGGVVVLAVAGTIATALWYKGQHELRASEALSAIRIPLSPNEPVPADLADQLRKLAQEYSGTMAATRAELIAASVLFTSGKYAEAQAAFEKFNRDHPESRWVSQSYYGLAVCVDAQSKTNDAISKYEDFARRFPTDPSIDQARLSLGTLYEALNKPGDAVKEYDKILKSGNPTPSQGEAQERQRRLFTKYPYLATNAMPVTPSLPSVTRTGAVSTIKSNVAPATNAPLILRTNVAPVAKPPLVLKTNLPTAKPAPTASTNK